MYTRVSISILVEGLTINCTKKSCYFRKSVCIVEVITLRANRCPRRLPIVTADVTSDGSSRAESNVTV